MLKAGEARTIGTTNKKDQFNGEGIGQLRYRN